MKRTITFAVLAAVAILALIVILWAVGLVRTESGSAKVIIEVTVEGLENGQTAEIKLLPDTVVTADRLQSLGIELPKWSVKNGTRKIAIKAFPAGGYKLMIYASETYYREPMGYLFQLSDSGIVNPSKSPFYFKLIPPSAQDVPPCRETGSDNAAVSTAAPLTEIPLDETHITCRAEFVADISSPPKQPIRQPTQ